MVSIRTVTALTALSVMVACSPVARKVDGNVAATETATNQLFEQARPSRSTPVMTSSNVPWLGNRIVPMKENKPGVFSTRIGFADADPVRLPVIAQRITEIVRVPVTLAPDLYEIDTDQTGVGGMQSSVLGASPITSMYGLAAQQAQRAIADIPISVPFEGTLEQYLDIVAARLNVAWTYRNSAILFHRYVTRVFYVHALPGLATISAGDSSGANSGGSLDGMGGVYSDNSTALSSSATSGMSVNMSSNISLWNSVVAGINAMLSKKGRVAVSESTGSVVVTDTPDVIRAVENYLDRENSLMVRQVAFEMRLLAVSTRDTESRGLNLAALFNDGKMSFSSVTQALPFEASNNFAVGIVETGSKWLGSEAIVQALSKTTKVRQSTSTTGITLNNQPIPMRVTRTEGYLAKVSVSTTDSTATRSLEQGKVTTGFKMNLLPRIMEDDQMLLQYAISLSSNLGFNTETSGSESIRTPTTEEREFIHRFRVRSGQVVIVTGFEQMSDTLTAQGTTAPDEWVLGGGRSAEQENTRLVLLITPVLLDNRAFEARN